MNRVAPRRLIAGLLLALPAACSGPAEPDAPNVLIFLIDTLRADHVSAYGHPHNTTPNLDAFAREGVLFENVFAQAPQTAPSHASLFTSTHPASHGIWNDVKTEGGALVHPRLADPAVTLAEVLHDAGWHTAAIADGGWLIEDRGLMQGFEHYETKNRGVVDRVERGIEWLEKHAGRKQPFFLFLHTYQVHTPYLPPVGYEDRFAGDYLGPMREVLQRAREYAESPEIRNPLTDVQQKVFNPALEGATAEDAAFLRALYDAELSLVDEQFALLMGWLRVNGHLDDTIVIVTSDHGEEFDEHGEFGHKQVYDECLRVPLLVHLPGGPRGLRRADAAQLVDLMPTLLAELGLEAPEAAVGVDLAWRGPDQGRSPDGFVGESNHPRHQLSWREGAGKVVLRLAPEAGEAAYDLAADPGERAPLPDAAERIAAARQALEAFQRAALEHRAAHRLTPTLTGLDELSEESRAELQQLGYVDQ
jgi:arylsulfatase A-like enzyme